MIWPGQEKGAGCGRVVWLWLAVIAAFPSGHAQAAEPAAGKIPPVWSLLAGYGETHPDLGKTKTRVETIDVVLRYEVPLTASLGRSWYQGHHALLVELPVSFAVYPHTDPMVGLTCLASWYFTPRRSWQPYLFAGGGIVYTGADIDGLGSELNGNWQAGAGVRYAVTGETNFFLEYRFHHISNLGTRQPNDPLNSSKLMLGITF